MADCKPLDLRPATAADLRQFPGLALLRACIRDLPDAQICVLAALVSRIVAACPSPVAAALLRQHPGWQSRPATARGVMLRILNSDDAGPVAAWQKAIGVVAGESAHD